MVDRPGLRIMGVAAFALALTGQPWAARAQDAAPAQAAQAVAPAAIQALRPDQDELILAALAQADAQGLGSAPDLQAIAADVRSGDPARRQAGEDRLRFAILDYADAQHGRRIRENDFPREWAIRPPAYDAGADFAAALAQDRLQPWLAGLAPPYQALIKAYGDYRQIVQAGGWPQIPAGPPLKLGSTGARVAALRRRLGRGGPDAERARPGPSRRGDAAVAGVRDLRPGAGGRGRPRPDPLRHHP
ncbi:MAG: hypothetical protein WDM92_01920 [Caulobacteraceae bacterium]